MHRSTTYIVAVAVGALVAVSGTLAAAEDAAKEHAELAKALSAAKVSLDRGLSAAATNGTPISAKFESEEGKLQLSVYTEKDGKFSEVAVDHVTGKAAKSEAITEGEDLAQGQSAAMAKAKLSLSSAVSKAVSANAGYHAVSVFPSLKDDHPVAEVTLHKGADWRTVTEKLY
jgi:hypothetical protein